MHTDQANGGTDRMRVVVMATVTFGSCQKWADGDDGGSANT